MARFFFLGILIATFGLLGCDPGYGGTSHIRNASSYALELKYKSATNSAHARDTSILIQPNTTVDFFKFGGLGAGKDYDCCPCDFAYITLQPVDTTKTLIKSISDSNNWILTNPNKRRFSNKEISCEFSVAESDIR